MTIMNDASASMTLGELNKNISALGKQLKKVSSGMRINGAGDGPSEYSISEKMRVRIRALDQDERNVLNGAALLRTAEGAIQQQIEIMKTIKEKVIDADNDTNTDLDRMTIQKEIDQGYQQIEDIAQETNYNGKRLLVGDTISAQVFGWEVLSAPEMLEGSESMKIIETSASGNDDPKMYAQLDGQVGPFAIFNKYALNNANNLSPLFGSASVSLGGGTAGTPNKMAIDFSTYDNLADLDGVGFRVSSVYSNGYSGTTYEDYVLSRDMSNKYNGVTVIDISRCNSMNDVANAVANTLSTYYNTNSAGGTTVTLTSKFSNADSNKNKIEGLTKAASTSYDPYREGANPSGISGTFRGGVDYVSGPDGHPAQKSTFSFHGVDASKVGTGIYVNLFGSNSYIKFSEGSDGIAYDAAAGIYRVGVNATTSQTIGGYYGYTFDLRDGNLTLTANNAGSWANGYSITSGFNEQQASTVSYGAVTALKPGAISNEQSGADGARAKKDIILPEAYRSTDSEMLERLIGDLTGKVLSVSSRGDFEFIDSGNKTSIDAVQKNASTTAVDLNSLRTTVQSGKTIAEAFATLMKGKNSSAFSVLSSGDDVVGFTINAYNKGTAGNNEKAYAKEAQLNSFTIDYSSWFSSNSNAVLPDDLKDKGFRVYCATDPAQWFNFAFVTGDEEEGRPKSGSSGADLYRIPVDVSEVTDAASLVKAIYDQAEPELKRMNHYIHLAADEENGTVTVYDDRRETLTKSKYFNMQEKGSKIADGVLDDVQKTTRNIYVKDLVIQHTDHASQNIHVRVPQTTMDHLFAFIPGSRKISEFNVMTAESREALLGNKEGVARNGRLILKEEKGYLDTALDYLTSANTLVGAQIMRLEMTQANIVTSRESTTNSESTIRDADMAKEMTGYTKANVLAQAAQSMLAQANQNSSGILNLLQ